MSGREQIGIDPPRQGFDPADEPRIWQLLVDADRSFIPPLSSRSSSVQSELGAHDFDPLGPRTYFASLREQWFQLARTDTGLVIGLMSHRPRYILPVDLEGGAHHYVSTVIVDRSYRRQGITRRMYTELLRWAAEAEEGVATRTWSTNDGHLALLAQMGFAVVHRLVDDRGGGLDTVYLVRHRAPAGASS